MTDLMRAPLTSTACDPFSGRRLAAPVLLDHAVPAEFDATPVPEGSVEEIEHWVDGSAERAAAAVLEEIGRDRPRKSLIKRLQAIGS